MSKLGALAACLAAIGSVAAFVIAVSQGTSPSILSLLFFGSMSALSFGLAVGSRRVTPPGIWVVSSLVVSCAEVVMAGLAASG
jgi:hypothetical protein